MAILLEESTGVQILMFQIFCSMIFHINEAKSELKHGYYIRFGHTLFLLEIQTSCVSIWCVFDVGFKYDIIVELSPRAF